MKKKLEKIEEHQAKGTSIRSRQEWDINAEGPGRILLKCEDRYGQQKYMSSVTKKNERGEIIEKITGQKKVQDETSKYWEKMFADEGITTEEEDIKEYLGPEASSKAKKLTEPEREEIVWCLVPGVWSLVSFVWCLVGVWCLVLFKR